MQAFSGTCTQTKQRFYQALNVLTHSAHIVSSKIVDSTPVQKFMDDPTLEEDKMSFHVKGHHLRICAHMRRCSDCSYFAW